MVGWHAVSIRESIHGLYSLLHVYIFSDRRGYRVLKENPPCGPYLRFSNRPPLQTLRVSDPATCHLLLLPETTELSCTPLRTDVTMLSPQCLPQLGDPLLELDQIGTQFLFCPEYAEGIFSYLKGIEPRFMPTADYLSKQQDINEGNSVYSDTLLDNRTVRRNAMHSG